MKKCCLIIPGTGHARKTVLLAAGLLLAIIPALAACGPATSGAVTAGPASASPAHSPAATVSADSLPEFTDAEVAAARAVVDEHYRALAAKDDEAILATFYPGLYQNGRVVLYGSETRTLLTADCDPQDPIRQNYKPGGESIAPENIMVFRVSFRVDIPKGREEDSNFNAGVYDDWSMILIRDDQNSPWFIFDQGY